MNSSETLFEIPLGRKKITVGFTGGAMSSDAGLVLLSQADKEIGLVSRLAACMRDHRDQRKVKQSAEDMLRQRIFGIAQGYEDCNDHDSLRSDPLFKLSAGRQPESGEDLASQPTLSRLENSIGRVELWQMEEVFVDGFIASHADKPVKELVIDADATDDPCHGQQEFEFYHGFYGSHCYLPLLVYATADEGEQELIGAVLRRGNVHAGHRLVSVLRRIISKLSAAFPEAKIVFRGDAGMALPEVYDFCEDAGISYLISLGKNPRLLSLAEDYLSEARRSHEATGEKVRLFGDIVYAAETWRRKRRVVVKAEVLDKGENPRFVVTNLSGEPRRVYEKYIDRGDVENRIKELKDDLLSGRTSCHSFLANQLRLILHAAAFVLMQGLRKLLSGTEMATAQCSTLRVKLLKVGVQVRETTRRIWLALPSSYPYKRLWEVLLNRLVAAQ